MGAVQLLVPQLYSYPYTFRPIRGSALETPGELVLTRKDHRTRGRARIAPSGLFLRFAETPRDIRGLADFASRFGPLTRDFLHPDDNAVETLGTWADARDEVAEAVRVWSAAVPGDREADSRLSRLCQPHLESALHAVLSPRDPHSDFPAGLVAMPRNLKALMWIQLAQAAAGEGELRKCEECPNWYVVADDKRSRTSRKYCSPTCRVNAYRRLSRRGEGVEGDDGG